MMRARVRDQRLQAGVIGSAFVARICIGIPLAKSIARRSNAFPRMRPARTSAFFTLLIQKAVSQVPYSSRKIPSSRCRPDSA
jgi:hypothetical protein